MYVHKFFFQPGVIPDIVITLGVIGGCALLGLGIAKIGDYCYDRRMAMRDDISNASEYTKNILRQRYGFLFLILACIAIESPR